MMVRKFLLLFLMVAVVGLGIAQARGDLCPPGCDHCQAVRVVQPDRHACCQEQDEAAAGPLTARAAELPKAAGCEHDGLSCLASRQLPDALAGTAYPSVDLHSLVLPGAGPVLPRLTESSIAFLPKGPPLRRAPDLYTRNCSFLI